jgi:nitroreductase
MEVDQALARRRAVNFFDPHRPVPPELLRRLVETAARAPSSFNLQPWQLVILTDQEDKARLRELAMDQPKVTEAPVVLMFLADRDGWQEGHPWMEHNWSRMAERGAPPEQREWFVNACRSLYGASPEAAQAFACKNAGFFAMAVMLAAKHLGLETHPMDGFDHDAVRESFQIPERYWIPLLMCVGYFAPDKELSPPKWRKSFEEIVLRWD